MPHAAPHPDAVFSAYFHTVPFRETPFADLAGLHPMTADTAETRNHYRFDYDAQGRPVRVSFRLGDHVRALNTTANYYVPAPRIDIRYEPGLEIRHFYDPAGNRMAVQGDIFEARFVLDARGYRQRLTFSDVHGEPTETSWGVGVYEWTLLDDGTVLEHREGLDGRPAMLRQGFPFYNLRLHYGPSGWLALMENYGTDGQLTRNPLNAAQDRLSYAANGDMRAWTVLDETGAPVVGNGPGVARGRIGYDENGLQISQHHEDAEGRLMVSAYGWGVTRSQYDAFGNIVARGNFALDGVTPADNPHTGYASYRYEWDARGLNQESLALLHADGSPALHPRGGFSIRRQTHDARGQMLEARVFGTQGEAVVRTDSGEHLRRHTYDARGRRVETRLYGIADAAVAHAREGWHREVIRYVGDTAVEAERVRYDLSGEEMAR